MAEKRKKVCLSDFVENPENPQTVTVEAFDRLVEKIKRVPEGLRAQRIAYVTDHPAGKCVVLAGNKRLRALKRIYSVCGRVPADWFQDITHLTAAQRAEFLVTSNVNEGEWDVERLLEQYGRDDLCDYLGGATVDDLLRGLVVPEEEPAVETSAVAAADDRSDADDGDDDDDGEYEAFVDKFKLKKTTDDCYTPENIYAVVADYVELRFLRDRKLFVRPFFPGGDYKSFDYPPGCTVVDNPPFSILAEIVRFYLERDIAFFLFAPTLTLFTAGNDRRVRYYVCGATITFENGAKVNTSFISSFGGNQLTTVPDLYKAIKDANEKNVRAQSKELPKIEYPLELITAARASYYAKHGVSYAIRPCDAAFVRALDAQKSGKKGIFGGGFLLSRSATAEREAAEREAAECYKLSRRERAICDALGDDPGEEAETCG